MFSKQYHYYSLSLKNEAKFEILPHPNKLQKKVFKVNVYNSAIKYWLAQTDIELLKQLDKLHIGF